MKVAIPGTTINNYFYNITGSNNLTITTSTINKTMPLDINKFNISGLSNYYNREQVDLLTSNYYLKSETNTYFYDKVATDSRLNNYYNKTTTDSILNNSYQEK